MPMPSRNPEDKYTLQEVEQALKHSQGFLTEDVIKSVYERMISDNLQAISKADLSESEYESIDWALPGDSYFRIIAKTAKGEKKRA